MIFSTIVESDVIELARVHIDCWDETYRGLIPDVYLDKMSHESRVSTWHSVLKSGNHYGEIVREDGKIVGFLSAGHNRNESEAMENEIFALYILKKFQRKNAGRMLCDRFFTSTGINDACAWVLRDNPSCKFYERLGGKVIQEREIEIGGKVLPEVLYQIAK